VLYFTFAVHSVLFQSRDNISNVHHGIRCVCLTFKSSPFPIFPSFSHVSSTLLCQLHTFILFQGLPPLNLGRSQYAEGGAYTLYGSSKVTRVHPSPPRGAPRGHVHRQPQTHYTKKLSQLFMGTSVGTGGTGVGGKSGGVTDTSTTKHVPHPPAGPHLHPSIGAPQPKRHYESLFQNLQYRRFVLSLNSSVM
jgi:hypothetical protein